MLACYIRFSLLLMLIFVTVSQAQEKSVNPGINDSFQNPDVKKYEGVFEGESREIFAQREAVLKAIGLKPGDIIADIGAGTGLYTRLFAKAVGEKGSVYAVDIAQNFLDHIAKVNTEAKIGNVKTILCKPFSAELPANSIDVAFICDTYHHFEFPARTMASIHTALKPGGRVVVIDFHRIKGKSRDWVMTHVRAGQEVFEQEILEAGFRKLKVETGILKENYFEVFEKRDPRFVFPAIADYGGIVPLPHAIEQPSKGTKVVIDITATAKVTGQPLPGLERAATLLNLSIASGLKESDLEIAIVLHGDATFAALNDTTHYEKTGRINDNNLLITRLRKAGVKMMVCGQSVERKGLDSKSLRPEISIAASAITAIANHQSRGFAYIPSH